jgi:hypothetical protein
MPRGEVMTTSAMLQPASALRGSGASRVEMFTNLVFLISIGWYFLGILPTNTKGKLGWYISASKN